MPPLPPSMLSPSAQTVAGPNHVDIGPWDHNGTFYSSGPANSFTSLSTPAGTILIPASVLAGLGGPADDGKSHMFEFFSVLTPHVGVYMMLS